MVAVGAATQRGAARAPRRGAFSSSGPARLRKLRWVNLVWCLPLTTSGDWLGMWAAVHAAWLVVCLARSFVAALVFSCVCRTCYLSPPALGAARFGALPAPWARAPWSAGPCTRAGYRIGSDACAMTACTLRPSMVLSCIDLPLQFIQFKFELQLTSSLAFCLGYHACS